MPSEFSFMVYYIMKVPSASIAVKFDINIDCIFILRVYLVPLGLYVGCVTL